MARRNEDSRLLSEEIIEPKLQADTICKDCEGELKEIKDTALLALKTYAGSIDDIDFHELRSARMCVVKLAEVLQKQRRMMEEMVAIKEQTDAVILEEEKKARDLSDRLEVALKDMSNARSCRMPPESRKKTLLKASPRTKARQKEAHDCTHSSKRQSTATAFPQNRAFKERCMIVSALNGRDEPRPPPQKKNKVSKGGGSSQAREGGCRTETRKNGFKQRLQDGEPSQTNIESLESSRGGKPRVKKMNRRPPSPDRHVRRETCIEISAPAENVPTVSASQDSLVGNRNGASSQVNEGGEELKTVPEKQSRRGSQCSSPVPQQARPHTGAQVPIFSAFGRSVPRANSSTPRRTGNSSTPRKSGKGEPSPWTSMACALRSNNTTSVATMPPAGNAWAHTCALSAAKENKAPSRPGSRGSAGP